MQDGYACVTGWEFFLSEEGNEMNFEWNPDYIKKELQVIWNNKDLYFNETVAFVKSLSRRGIEKLRENFGDQFPDLFEWIDSVFPPDDENMNDRGPYLLAAGIN